MFTRLGLPMNHVHYFVLPSENQNAFARSADFKFQLILYLGPSNFGSEIVLKN